MNKQLIIIGALLAGLGVILGAFGAHALGDHLSTAQLKTYQTGIEYHFIHSLALCILAIASTHVSTKWQKIISYLFLAGIVFFSGSLYLLACRNLLHIESWKWIGPITPIGGLCFILAWFLFAYAVWTNKKA
jgi:uncharacterized membrane protein YgdD (TMEM256/DUF423 family)